MPQGSCEPLRVWSRLEVRPRQVELDRCLEGRVEDALWMLTRQWQFGEFHGSDTGSAVTAALARHVTPLATVQLGDGDPQPYDPSQPLEPQVERLPIDFPPAVRAQVAEYLMALLADRLPPTADVDAYRAAFSDLHPLTVATAAGPVGQARERVAGRARRIAGALAGRSFDGVAVARSLPSPVTPSSLPLAIARLVTPDDETPVLGALSDFVAWFAATFEAEDAAADAWAGDRLEYDYKVTTASGLTLRGGSTPSGRLDWYGFAAETGQHEALPEWEVACAIPRGVSYAGMPSPRWWQLEDAAVSLGGLRADSTDLAKILVTEFALVFGNDWLEIPYDQGLGSLAEIGGIVVTDVFGTRTLVRAATGWAGHAWDAWDLFSLSPASSDTDVAALGQHLFIPPSCGLVQDGPDIEDVNFVRDEDANMVWAIEARVPDGAGGGRDGADAAHRMAAALHDLAAERTDGVPAAVDGAKLRFVLGTPIPENWIPFVPVHWPHNTHAIRFQRGWTSRAFPRGSRVRPQTSILREGIEAEDQAAPYFVNEEEVPRAGTRVRGAMRRGRWTSGSAMVWHARRTETGRGEVASGLRFDVLEPPSQEG
jgi:hypothetical protein